MYCFPTSTFFLSLPFVISSLVCFFPLLPLYLCCFFPCCLFTLLFLYLVVSFPCCSFPLLSLSNNPTTQSFSYLFFSFSYNDLFFLIFFKYLYLQQLTWHFCFCTYRDTNIVTSVLQFQVRYVLCCSAMIMKIHYVTHEINIHELCFLSKILFQTSRMNDRYGLRQKFRHLIVILNIYNQ